MKKSLIFVLIVAIMLLFVACGGEDTPENETIKAPETEQGAVDTEQELAETVPEKEESVSHDTEVPDVSNPTESERAPEVTTKPQTPATKPDAPTTKPGGSSTKPNDTETTMPSTPTVPVQPESTYSISEVHELIKAEYGGDYNANTAIPSDAMESLFGIDMSQVAEYIAEQPMISANIDTFIAIHANKGSGSSVAASLEGYLARLNGNDACLYPSNIPKAQAGKVVRHGDYVFLVMLGAAGDIEQDEQTQIKFAKDQVARGVNVINNYFAK